MFCADKLDTSATRWHSDVLSQKSVYCVNCVVVDILGVAVNTMLLKMFVLLLLWLNLFIAHLLLLLLLLSPSLLLLLLLYNDIHDS